MSAPQNFRSAFNGFRREDVVQYLEYINTKHNDLVNRLTSEAEYLRSRLENAAPAQDETIAALEAERDELKAKLEEMTERCAQLESRLAQQPEAARNTADELEAYRRAERTERLARERADLVFHQVNGVLAEATSKVDSVAAEVGGMADQVMSQLTQLQTAVCNSKQALKDAASTMYAIRPNE